MKFVRKNEIFYAVERRFLLHCHCFWHMMQDVVVWEIYSERLSLDNQKLNIVYVNSKPTKYNILGRYT